jgi:hypothetical protein
MDRAKYLVAASFAEPWLIGARPIPERAGVEHQCSARKAVYIVCDYSGAVVYVGSTSRYFYATARRLSEHLRGPKCDGWSTVWTVPLREETPSDQVLRIEALIGRYLRPRENRRLPSL